MAYKMTKEESEAFLADLHVGIIGINGQRRGPLMLPIWYSYIPDRSHPTSTAIGG